MQAAAPQHEQLPRHDWILLPLIVLVVTLTFFGMAEVVASRMFEEQGQPGCISRDRPGPPRNTPNCSYRYKIREGPLVEYRFNQCGFRSTASCDPKSPGTLRVVVLGTSLTMGLGVPNDQTFASRLQDELNQICTRPVEVENMGTMMTFPGIPDLAKDALSLSPDVIVLTVLPFDLEQFHPSHQSAPQRSEMTRVRSIWRNWMLRLRSVGFVFAAQHFMMLNKELLYKSYLSGAGSRELMSARPVPGGEQKYANFERTLTRLQEELEGSGVPLIVVAAPNRVGAALVSDHYPLEGTDPARFGRRISEIAALHGAIPVDATPDFAKVPHAEQLYYPVDNHPTGEGHAVLARILQKHLTDGTLPQLSACTALRAGSR